MFSGYVDNRMSDKALDLFEQLPEPPDDVLQTILFNVCSSLCNERAVRLGHRILDTVPTVPEKSYGLISSILGMLMKFGHIRKAEELFETIDKTLNIYGVMLQGSFHEDETSFYHKTNLDLFVGYLLNGLPEKTLDLFEQLPEPANNVIYAIVLNACSLSRSDRAIQLGNRLYRKIRTNIKDDNVLLGSLLHMLMKFGQIQEAEHLFSQINQPTVQIYGVMMHGYNANNQPRSSWKIFQMIRRNKLVPNDAAFLALINAASQIGMQSFCRTVVGQLTPGFRNDLKIKNALIDMWVSSSPSAVPHSSQYILLERANLWVSMKQSTFMHQSLVQALTLTPQ